MVLGMHSRGRACCVCGTIGEEVHWEVRYYRNREVNLLSSIYVLSSLLDMYVLFKDLGPSKQTQVHAHNNLNGGMSSMTLHHVPPSNRDSLRLLDACGA